MGIRNWFCVQQRKEIHTGLEQLEGEQMMIKFLFLLNYPFKELYFLSTLNVWFINHFEALM